MIKNRFLFFFSSKSYFLTQFNLPKLSSSYTHIASSGEDQEFMLLTQFYNTAEEKSLMWGLLRSFWVSLSRDGQTFNVRLWKLRLFISPHLANQHWSLFLFTLHQIALFLVILKKGLEIKTQLNNNPMHATHSCGGNQKKSSTCCCSYTLSVLKKACPIKFPLTLHNNNVFVQIAQPYITSSSAFLFYWLWHWSTLTTRYVLSMGIFFRSLQSH